MAVALCERVEKNVYIYSYIYINIFFFYPPLVISHRVCLIISKCTPPNINRFLRDAPDFLGIGVYIIIYIMSTVFAVVVARVGGVGGVKKRFVISVAVVDVISLPPHKADKSN